MGPWESEHGSCNPVAPDNSSKLALRQQVTGSRVGSPESHLVPVMQVLEQRTGRPTLHVKFR